MSEHTKGPWEMKGPLRATENGRLEVWGPTGEKFGYNKNLLRPDMWPVCAVARDRSENVANARLIAAAPELLEALSLAIDTLDGYVSLVESDYATTSNPDPAKGIKAAIALIDAAIAKATGK